MKKINVEKWFEYEDSTRLDEQVKYFIASEVEAGLNCYYDNNNEKPMTKEEWKDYVWNAIKLLKDMRVNGNEFNHLKFYSKEKFLSLVDIYLDNYEDVKPYIAR